MLNKRPVDRGRKEGRRMIWQFMTGKKEQRQLQLIELLKKECYSVKELMERLGVSRKTVVRDLTALQEKGYAKKTTYWQLDWSNVTSFSQLYRKILLASPTIKLFQQFLWGDGPQEIEYRKIKQLNTYLLSWNLSVNRREGCLSGDARLIFHLQLKFLRDFCQLEERALYHRLTLQYEERPLLYPRQELIPDKELLATFAANFSLPEKIAELCFFDYLRYHIPACLSFYLCHENYQTPLYQEITRSLQIIKMEPMWEVNPSKYVFILKLFDLFLGIQQGLPLTVFNQKWKTEEVPELLFSFSKELKRSIPLLRNCRIDELALALNHLLHSSYQVALSLNPNLKTSSRIQEGYQAFISSTKRI